MRWHSKERRQMDYYNNLVTDKDLVKEVKLFSLADTFIGKFRAVFQKYYRGFRQLVFKDWFFNSLFNLLVAAVLLVIQIPLACRILQGTLQIGDFSLYSSAVNNIYYSVAHILALSMGIYEGTLFIDNMIAFMEQRPSVVPSLPEPLRVEKNKPHVIEFQHVSFCYPASEKKVLDDVSVTIASGETVVLVGLNGAGKTTLVKLLCGLIDPTEGQVLYDGIDIREYNRTDFYKQFSAVFQQYSIMPVTIEEIVSETLPEHADPVKVRHCLTTAGLWNKIVQLPDGIKSQFGRALYDNGIELSGGEVQKLLFARALYKDAPVILLDEPTAALDPIAESKLYENYNKISAGKTTVFISHRLASTSFCDRIILIENGAICEEGTHNELLKLNGTYYKLFELQAKYYREKSVETEVAK